MDKRLILREATLAVIAAAKTIAGFKAARAGVAIVGLAITHLTNHRKTKVDSINDTLLFFVH